MAAMSDWRWDVWILKIFRRAPALGMFLAEWTRRFRRPSDRGQRSDPVASRKELGQLFPGLPKRRLREIQARSLISDARNALVIALEQREGHDRLQGLVDLEPGSEATLQRLIEQSGGVILTTWHMGPTPGIWAVVRRYPQIRLLKVQNRPWDWTPEGWDLVRGSFEPMAGLVLLRRARKHLGGGGWVAMTFDHTFSGTREHRVSFLGRVVEFRTGLGALALETGAPVVVMSARWSGRVRRIEVRVHEPIYPEGSGIEAEKSLIEHLVGEMQQYVLANPWEQLGPRCRRILDYPRLGDPSADAPRPGARWGWTRGRRYERARELAAEYERQAQGSRGPGTEREEAGGRMDGGTETT